AADQCAKFALGYDLINSAIARCRFIMRLVV
ncbi:unnamed protein product, partial [Mesorhabditis spiculigera]